MIRFSSESDKENKVGPKDDESSRKCSQNNEP